MHHSLRLAALADISLITELIQRSVRQLHARDYSPPQIEAALGTVFAVDCQLIADQTFFVVEQGDQIVGCGGWSRRKSLYGADTSAAAAQALVPGVDAARIRAFFVSPEHARQGVGSTILRRCEADARAAGFTELTLVATLAGVPLYRACGFETVEPVTVRLSNGLDLPCLRMRKSLAAGSPVLR